MALTSVANNSAGTLSQAGQQKTAENIPGKENKSQLAGENRPTAKVGDTVTLSQPEKSLAPAATLGEKQAGDVLPRAKAAILHNSKAAVASQANVSADRAKEVLVGS